MRSPSLVLGWPPLQSVGGRRTRGEPEPREWPGGGPRRPRASSRNPRRLFHGDDARGDAAVPREEDDGEVAALLRESRLQTAWQETVFARPRVPGAPLAEDKSEPEVVENMRTWPHSGFSVDRYRRRSERLDRQKFRRPGSASGEWQTALTWELRPLPESAPRQGFSTAYRRRRTQPEALVCIAVEAILLVAPSAFQGRTGYFVAAKRNDFPPMYDSSLDLLCYHGHRLDFAFFQDRPVPRGARRL